MKKIIKAMVLFLILSTPAYADMKVLDSPQVLDDAVQFGVVQSLTACVRGHVFLITYGKAPVTIKGESYGMTISTVQIYEDRNGRTSPMRCK